MPTTKEENTTLVKPVAKARPRLKPTVTLTSTSFPVLERIWIDIETQRSNNQKCFEVSKAITRLLQHDQSVPRGNDGAIHFNCIIEECRRKKFNDAFPILCESKLPNQFLYLRAIQGHSGESAIDPALHARQKTDPERIHRVSLPRPERKRIEFYDKKWINSRRNEPQKRKTSSLLHNSEPDGGWIWDLTKPRIMPYKNTWERFQNTVFSSTWDQTQWKTSNWNSHRSSSPDDW